MPKKCKAIKRERQKHAKKRRAFKKAKKKGDFTEVAFVVLRKDITQNLAISYEK
jgi:hypothetical protein